MRTPRSMTTFFSRARAADLDVRQDHGTLERGVGMTWTPVNSSERRSEAPETMQPPDTSEVTAMPRRPSSSWTNLAGGVISA